jgi:hypothetical protein
MHTPSDLAGFIFGDIEARRDNNIRAACGAVAEDIAEAIENAPPRLATDSGLSKNERRKREAKVGEDDNAMIARRILADELEEALEVLDKSILEPARWPGWSDDAPPQWWQTWLTYRADLVSDMTDDGYAKLKVAFAYVRKLQDGLRAEQREFVPTDELFLADTRTAIVQGKAALGRRRPKR